VKSRKFAAMQRALKKLQVTDHMLRLVAAKFDALDSIVSRSVGQRYDNFRSANRD
jgi:hypothetical protein